MHARRLRICFSVRLLSRSSARDAKVGINQVSYLRQQKLCSPVLVMKLTKHSL